MKEKILILGDGLLGSELIKQTGWDYISPSKDNIDVIKKYGTFINKILDIKPDVIINCIGYTNTYDKERQKHWDLNYKFVVNLTDFCSANDIKLVHVSTDYIYANSTGTNREIDVPVHQETWYGYTKLLSDAYVQLNSRNYLMFRCGFKPKPFPYDKAYVNIKGNFDYVDVIARQMIELIKENRTGIWNIGTEYKSIYDLAFETKPDVGEALSFKLPTIMMSLFKFKNR